MSKGPQGLTVSSWCRTHKSSSPRLTVRCPYGRHDTHIHDADVSNAKRGWRLTPDCLVCKRAFCIIVGGRLKVVRAVASDQGNPAVQLTLDSKSH